MSAYLDKITSIVLNQVANGSPTLEILNEICTSLEQDLPGSIVVPTVQPPSRQGYGQKTLSRSVASAFDGTVELDYRPEGLLCSVTAPFSPRLGARPN